MHKRRGKPLRYNMSSLRDLMVAKFLPDTNNKVWGNAGLTFVYCMVSYSSPLKGAQIIG